jgi:hypothetical protein
MNAQWQDNCAGEERSLTVAARLGVATVRDYNKNLEVEFQA